MHGSKCVPDDFNEKGEIDFKCDCKGVRDIDGDYVAGEYCQHPVSEYCTKDDTRGKSENAFCTNGGSCLAKIQGNQAHPGCLCKEGWTGDHCDFRHKNDLPQSFSNTKGNRSANMTAIIFSCMALTIMVIIAGAVFVTRKLIAKEQVQAQIDAEQSKGNVANVNEATEDGMVSEDFYDLKDVELI